VRPLRPRPQPRLCARRRHCWPSYRASDGDLLPAQLCDQIAPEPATTHITPLECPCSQPFRHVRCLRIRQQQIIAVDPCLAEVKGDDLGHWDGCVRADQRVQRRFLALIRCS